MDITCTLKLKDNVVSSCAKPVRAVYRISHFSTETSNTLMRLRDHYSSAEIDEKTNQFHLELDTESEKVKQQLKNGIISIYFYCEDSNTRSGQSCVYMGMWCELNKSTSTSFQVYEQGWTSDEEKKVVGQLRLSQPITGLSSSRYQALVESEIKKASGIEQQIKSAYSRFEYSFHRNIQNPSYFHYVNDTIARLPVLFFAAMSIFTGWDNTYDALLFYKNILQVAKLNCGMNKDDDITNLIFKLDTSTLCHIIQEMFTVHYRCLQYKNDENVNNNDVDRWNVLNMSPNLNRQSFDCEDGARAVMDLFLAFMKLEPEMVKYGKEFEELLLLCNYLSHYTPSLCIGELTVNEAADIHVYCILLHTDYMESLTKTGKSSSKKDFLPCIHLETTHHSLGTWDDTKAIKQTKEESAYEFINQKLSECSGDLGVSRHLVKLRAPLKNKMHPKPWKKRLYQNIRVLLCPMFKGDCVQFLVTQNSSTYAEALDFMNMKEGIKLHEIYKIPVSTLQQDFKHLFSVLPSSYVPKTHTKVNDDANDFLYSNVLANFEIQETYYEEKKNRFDMLLQDVASHYPVSQKVRLHYATRHISKNISIVQVWLVENSPDSSFSSSSTEMMKIKTKTKTKTKTKMKTNLVQVEEDEDEKLAYDLKMALLHFEQDTKQDN